MPSLARTAPNRVLWIAHADQKPRTGGPDDAPTPAIGALLQAWADHGAAVQVATGPTDEILAAYGWTDPATGRRDTPDDKPPDWEAYIRQWADGARRHDPTGLGWVSGLLGTLGRFSEAQRALADATPSSDPDGLWTPARRLMEIAETAYLLDDDRKRVRDIADEVLQAARAARQSTWIAGAHHLKARTWRVTDDQDLDAATKEIEAAREAIAGHGLTGREADLDLETARIAIAQGDEEAAVTAARRAADRFEETGDWMLVSEALQVAGHAHALNSDYDAADRDLRRALQIAQTGPYPEREIAAHLSLAALKDITAEDDAVLNHARAAIHLAHATGHAGELAQAYAYLGLTLSELGDHAGAAEAFADGLGSIVQATTTMGPLLAVGLADSLLHLGRSSQALDVLRRWDDAIEGSPRRALHAAAIRWRAGQAGDDDVVQAARTLARPDLEPDGQTVMALLRLGVPGDDVEAVITEAFELMRDAGQTQRLARYEDARVLGWQPVSEAPDSRDGDSARRRS
jgi:tetratricopeptide (TPR) repeat protein